MSDCETTMAELREMVDEFVRDRAWGRFHNSKNLSMSIAIEAGELMELFQWESLCHIDESLERPEFRERTLEELADVVIYCLSLANHLEADLSDAVIDKLAKNGSKYPADRCLGDPSGGID